MSAKNDNAKVNVGFATIPADADTVVVPVGLECVESVEVVGVIASDGTPLPVAWVATKPTDADGKVTTGGSITFKRVVQPLEEQGFGTFAATEGTKAVTTTLAKVKAVEITPVIAVGDDPILTSWVATRPVAGDGSVTTGGSLTFKRYGTGAAIAGTLDFNWRAKGEVVGTALNINFRIKGW